MLGLAVSKTEKQHLEHLSKQSVDDINVRFLILTKVLIYSGCQMSASMSDITSITSSTSRLMNKLRKVFTLIWSFVEKAHRSFSLVKTSLTFRLLQNLLQSWSTFFCVCLECSPVSGSLKYLILTSDFVF